MAQIFVKSKLGRQNKYYFSSIQKMLRPKKYSWILGKLSFDCVANFNVVDLETALENVIRNPFNCNKLQLDCVIVFVYPPENSANEQSKICIVIRGNFRFT